jgi:hypothetical protein
MAFLILSALLIGGAVVLWWLPRNSRWPWKLIGRVAAGILMCSSALSLLLFAFGVMMCGRYEFPPIKSRNGNFTAEVNEKDCGAVDSFHSSVQVWQNRQGLFARLFGKRGHSATVFTIGHDPRLIELSWKGDRTLLIRYPNDSRDPDEFRCQARWEDVQIDCVGYTPDYSKPVGEMPPVQRWTW